MPLRVECPICHAHLKAPDEQRGKQIRCPKCAKIFLVPGGPVASGSADKVMSLPVAPVLTKKSAPTANGESRGRAARPSRDEERRPVPPARRSRREEDDDDFDEERPRRKKASALPWVLAASGTGVVLIAGTVVAVIALSKGDTAKQPLAQAPPPGMQPAAVAQPAPVPGKAPAQSDAPMQPIVRNDPPMAIQPAQPVQPKPNTPAPAQPAPAQPAPVDVAQAEAPPPAVPGVNEGPLEDAGKPPAGWKKFVPKDKSFSVWLPDRGGRRSEREGSFSSRGLRVKLNIVNLQANDGMLYSAATIILSPLTARKIPVQTRLELMRDAFLNEVKGRVEGETDIRLKNAPGREYLITAGQAQARLRTYTQGSRIYRAVVMGTPQQIQSADANTFLNSYRLSGFTGQPPTGVNPPVAKQPGPGPAQPKPSPAQPALTGTPAAAAGIKITGDVFAFAQEAVKEKRLAEIDIRGFTLSKNRYHDTLEEGGVLIGFQVGYGKFVNFTTVNALRPIFLTKDGEKLGQWHGQAPATPAVFKAKDGYVVGSIMVRTGIVVNSLTMTFAKLTKDGLDTKDNYNGELIGGADGGNLAMIGGRGQLFVGVTGHIGNQGVPCSLGLLAVTPKQ